MNFGGSCLKRGCDLTGCDFGDPFSPSIPSTLGANGRCDSLGIPLTLRRFSPVGVGVGGGPMFTPSARSLSARAASSSRCLPNSPSWIFLL